MVEPLMDCNCTPVLPAVYSNNLTLLETISHNREESNGEEEITSGYL